MRMIPLLCIALLIGPAAASTATLEGLEDHLRRSPYDDTARARLIEVYHDSRSYSSAYYHAAWLTWLSSRQYADSEFGIAFLRERSNRDRAGATGDARLTLVLAAVQAQQMLYDTALNGAVAHQSARLRREIRRLLTDAESQAASREADPVSRIALVHIGLALDDALVLEGATNNIRERVTLLRTAASRASTVATWLPESPGAHRALAIVRARIAEIDNRSPRWDLAIADAERALALDPEDPALVNLLWVLTLRAGYWSDAKAWQSRVEAMNACHVD